jgi:protein TonB
MSSIYYALNIGTLAGWLAVAGASTVAWVVEVEGKLPALLENEARATDLFITSQEMGSAAPADELETEPAAEPVASAPEEVVELPETLETPELPELAELAPLPEIPRMPEPAAAVVAAPVSEPRPVPRVPARPATPAVGSGRPSSAGAGRGQGDGTASGSGSSEVGSSRWEGLRKSSPNYPVSARRLGQEGKVVVQFTVDDRGYVVDARILSPSPYPALNEEALQTVRRFRARPGVRATTSQPIIFRLN